MNASSFVGRLSPGWFANRLGSHNIIVTATFCCAILIFGMIGISSVASVVVIAVIYGFFVGTCAYRYLPSDTLLKCSLGRLAPN